MEALDMEDDCIGQRCEPRTVLSVRAAMVSATASGPVSVRNLSRNGGMIEAEALPAVGEALTLRRGSLEARGRVMWKVRGRAGLRWDAPITVGAWLPSRHSGQSLVDATFEQLQANRDALLEPAQDAPFTPAFDASELRQTAAALDLLADLLAVDNEVIARYGPRLQALDIASQTISRIADSLSGRG